MTFRIWVALDSLQYLDNHELQRFDFCIECTPTDRTCQLYNHQVKIMINYDGTNNLVSGAFLKCFNILSYTILILTRLGSALPLSLSTKWGATYTSRTNLVYRESRITFVCSRRQGKKMKWDDTISRSELNFP